jgi:hypothetical protein
VDPCNLGLWKSRLQPICDFALFLASSWALLLRVGNCPLDHRGPITRGFHICVTMPLPCLGISGETWGFIVSPFSSPSIPFHPTMAVLDSDLQHDAELREFSFELHEGAAGISPPTPEPFPPLFRAPCSVGVATSGAGSSSVAEPAEGVHAAFPATPVLATLVPASPPIPLLSPPLPSYTDTATPAADIWMAPLPIAPVAETSVCYCSLLSISSLTVGGAGRGGSRRALATVPLSMPLLCTRAFRHPLILLYTFRSRPLARPRAACWWLQGSCWSRPC